MYRASARITAVTVHVTENESPSLASFQTAWRSEATFAGASAFPPAAPMPFGAPTSSKSVIMSVSTMALTGSDATTHVDMAHASATIILFIYFAL